MFHKLRKLFKKESEEIESCLADSGIAFDNLETAKAFYSNKLKEQLAQLEAIKTAFPKLTLNHKAASLKDFEQLYFDIYTDKTKSININKSIFEELMTVYMRNVFVTAQLGKLQVIENHFGPGRYQQGILFADGAWTNKHYARNLDQKKGNKTRSHLYQIFMEMVADEFKDKV